MKVHLLNILGFCLLCATIAKSQKTVIDLNQNWEFKKQVDTNWQAAIVPGTVQSNLLDLGQIPHPHIANNEDSIRWIQDHQWEFRTTFGVSQEKINNTENQKAILHFYGLDTYAKVFLNDTLILEADNMFREWKPDIMHLLKLENELRIVFTSPKEKHRHHEFITEKQLPHDGAPPRPLTRKAAYQFGWDWGPKIVTIGVWRPINLVLYEQNYIEDVVIQTMTANKNMGVLKTQIKLKENISNELTAHVYLDTKKVIPHSITRQDSSYELTITEPRIWWPRGFGRADLTDVKIDLLDGDEIIDSWTGKTGIRTTEIRRDIDSIGTSFYFKINDKPIFCKGANYIPQSHFLTKVTKEDYRRLLKDLVAANMNMVRVWGGGIYEEDYFYELCDSLGIMVWQDFMFANTMYIDELNDNIKNEIKDNVTRLANHSSIVHWCGNNEVDMAWQNWGWQKQYEIKRKDQKALKANYDYLFLKLIPTALHSILPGVPYSSTSPLSNWGKIENFDHHSMHNWGVFHGEEPFEEYAVKIGRFVSEYGFQSYPGMASLEYLFGDQPLESDHPILDTRQKSYKGNRLIHQHMEPYFPEPKNIQELSYLSQLTQALGIKTAVQHHRSNPERCMGTLYWQLNDVWPAISWSSIDHNGEWRALHYHLKYAFDDPAVFVDTTNNKIELVVVNGVKKDFDVMLEYGLYGSELIRDTLISNAGSVMKIPIIEDLPKTEWCKIETPLVVKWHDGSGWQNFLHSFVPIKKMNLENPEIKYEIKPIKGVPGYEALIFIDTDVPTYDVFLDNDCAGHFSDNYFDLIPGKTKILTFNTDENCSDFESGFTILSLNDIILRQ